ncbi:MAG: hypothetical protein AAF560_30735 [Acidobacteriota bacterium]
MAISYELTADRLVVSVDGQVELDLAGSFEAAPVALFNHSQEGTIYRNLTIELLD